MSCKFRCLSLGVGILPWIILRCVVDLRIKPSGFVPLGKKQANCHCDTLGEDYNLSYGSASVEIHQLIAVHAGQKSVLR